MHIEKMQAEKKENRAGQAARGSRPGACDLIGLDANYAGFLFR
jgi:hypothetical protein